MFVTHIKRVRRNGTSNPHARNNAHRGSMLFQWQTRIQREKKIYSYFSMRCRKKEIIVKSEHKEEKKRRHAPLFFIHHTIIHRKPYRITELRIHYTYMYVRNSQKVWFSYSFFFSLSLYYIRIRG